MNTERLTVLSRPRRPGPQGSPRQEGRQGRQGDDGNEEDEDEDDEEVDERGKNKSCLFSVKDKLTILSLDQLLCV